MSTVTLLVFSLLFPIFAVSRDNGDASETIYWLGPIISFACVFMFHGLYEVSREMEEPFLVSSPACT